MIMELHTEICGDKSALDLFLDTLDEEHVKFNIEEEEVYFIKTCIERIVWVIADEVQMSATEGFLYLTERNLIKNPHLRLYNGDLGREFDSIIRAGSFYEGAKIGFPDEFDFIFIVSTLECVSRRKFTRNIKHKIDIKNLSIVVKEILTFENVQRAILKACQANVCEKRGIFPVHFRRFVEYTGPSAKLHFKYFRDIEHPAAATDIYVDFVPAIRIVDKDLRYKIHKECRLPEFADEVAKTGSVLFVDGKLTFTETEIHFMKNVLSSKHKQVYKLLKVLLIGTSEQKKQQTKQFYLMNVRFNVLIGLPSYQVKVALIWHHYECKDGETGQLSSCLLEVLKYLHAGYFNFKYWHRWYTKKITTPKLITYPIDRMALEYFEAKSLKSKVHMAYELDCLLKSLRHMQQERFITKYEVRYPVALNVAILTFLEEHPFWPRELPYILEESFIHSMDNFVPYLPNSDAGRNGCINPGDETWPCKNVIEDIATVYQLNAITSDMLRSKCEHFRLKINGSFATEFIGKLEALERESANDKIEDLITHGAESLTYGVSTDRISKPLCCFTTRICYRHSETKEFKEAKARLKYLKATVQSIDMFMTIHELEYTDRVLQFNRFFQQMTLLLIFEAMMKETSAYLQQLRR